MCFSFKILNWGFITRIQCVMVLAHNHFSFYTMFGKLVGDFCMAHLLFHVVIKLLLWDM